LTRAAHEAHADPVLAERHRGDPHPGQLAIGGTIPGLGLRLDQYHAEGAKVSYDTEQTPKGLAAANVRLV
jgi:hypothetical protein